MTSLILALSLSLFHHPLPHKHGIRRRNALAFAFTLALAVQKSFKIHQGQAPVFELSLSLKVARVPPRTQQLP